VDIEQMDAEVVETVAGAVRLLRRAAVTASAWCGAYCATTIVAMLVLMRYRRSIYSIAM
jgi:hypothetical protein